MTVAYRFTIAILCTCIAIAHLLYGSLLMSIGG